MYMCCDCIGVLSGLEIYRLEHHIYYLSYLYDSICFFPFYNLIYTFPNNPSLLLNIPK